MAPLPVIANTYRCALEWRDSATNQIAVNVIHVRQPSTDAVGVAGAVDAAAAINTAYHAVSTAKVEAIKVTPLDGSSSTFTRTTTNAHWVGEQSGDFIPGTSVIMAWGSTRRGRSYRGRTFLPFLAEALQSDGAISDASALIVQDAWESLDGNLITAGAELVIASYKLAVATAVASFQVKSALGTQRRRQTRVRYP